MTVKQRQHLLAYLGFYTLSIDGVWGAGSKKALKAFQSAYGITEKEWEDSLEKSLIDAVAGNLTPVKEVLKSDENVWTGIKYFTPEEFRCKCGGRYCNGDTATMNRTLLEIAEKVREHFDKPVTVSSGIRCPTHNRNVGGVWNSKHLEGTAMDFCVKGVSSSLVDAFVASFPEIKYHYKIDSGYVHMNV